MDGFTYADAEVIGPRNEVSIETHRQKYCLSGETFRESTGRIAAAMMDNETHRRQFLNLLRQMILTPAGRIQTAMGSPKRVTAYNCFTAPIIEDSLNGHNSIMDVASKAARTMQMGGGIGFDFSTLRPKGAIIKSLDSQSSGPVSFMKIYDAVCSTISSAGGRRGAMMGVLRCDHPSIEEFIDAKQDNTTLTGFNMSVACTDKFMDAVKNGDMFELVFNGQVYSTVDARALWDKIMRRTWDYAEPGVIFIDTVNKNNNINYCETIFTSNPCQEQPMGPNAACLLGSVDLSKLIKWSGSKRYFDFDLFKASIPVFVNALDNVIDRTIYPLPEQEVEAKAKRRMGIGIMGTANAIEALGFEYGTEDYIEMQSTMLRILRDECYRASVERAKDKGVFPLFNRDKYLEAEHIKTLPEDIRDGIYEHGIRNSHLTSIAPTGTISLRNDNVSSGIEPVFSYQQERDIRFGDGKRTVLLMDYGVANFGVYGRRADEISAVEHVKVMAAAQQFVDSSVSKTCNVGPDVTFPEFREIYRLAYNLGAKGCTTFRSNGKRFGILRSKDAVEGASCTFDPMTGAKTCS